MVQKIGIFALLLGVIACNCAFGGGQPKEISNDVAEDPLKSFSKPGYPNIVQVETVNGYEIRKTKVYSQKKNGYVTGSIERTKIIITDSKLEK